MDQIGAAIRSVQERIAAAASSAGRDPSEITLIAVTKTHPPSEILKAYQCGLRHFGENRLQEALPKIASLPADIVWHFIGALQANKAKRAAASFHHIHSVSSLEHIREIEKCGRVIQCSVQVNLTNEGQKSGVAPQALDGVLKAALECSYVQVRGLMTIGRLEATEDENRAVFRKLREMTKERGLPWTNMGMSGDFELAITEGASHVRIGSAIFGERI